jgi:uncharacterized protein YbjQ (UPF0145 family)
MRGRSRDVRRSSEVSSASLRALTSVGFFPVGVVIGNSTTHIARPLSIGADSRVSSALRGFAGDDGSFVPNVIQQHQAKRDVPGSVAPYLVAYPCEHFGATLARERPRVGDHLSGYNWELPNPGAALQECFTRALSRLRDRAIQHGAHGVVDAHLDVSGDPRIRGTMGVTLTGTAISVPGVAPIDTPFVAGINCQSFSKLLLSGIVPVRMALGAVLLSSWTGCQTRRDLESGYAKEVHQLADALSQAREIAIIRARGAASGDVMTAITVSHSFDKEAKTDYRVGAWASGTFLRRFAPRSALDMATVAVTMEQR